MKQYDEKPLIEEIQDPIDEKLVQPQKEPQIGSEAPCHQCGSSAPRKSHFRYNWKLRKLEKFMKKIAVPLSRKSSEFGCEPFAPLPVDEECQKAARIVAKFSHKTYYQQADTAPAELGPNEAGNPASPPTYPPHLVTIPPVVIANAVGLIVFTTCRLGFGSVSGSMGSGLLIVRQESGEWGTPIPIQSYSLGGGPVAFGAEISDRIYVLNNTSALELFKTAKFEIGPEVVLAAGPYGGGGGVTFSGMASKTQDTTGPTGAQTTAPQCSCGNQQGAFQTLRDSLAQPVYCYMHSRGLYAGLQAEGTVFVQHPEQIVPEKDAAVLINALNEAVGASQ